MTVEARPSGELRLRRPFPATAIAAVGTQQPAAEPQLRRPATRGLDRTSRQGRVTAMTPAKTATQIDRPERFHVEVSDPAEMHEFLERAYGATVPYEDVMENPSNNRERADDRPRLSTSRGGINGTAGGNSRKKNWTTVTQETRVRNTSGPRRRHGCSILNASTTRSLRYTTSSDMRRRQITGTDHRFRRRCIREV